MVGLIAKLVICPIAILISNALFGLQYTLEQALTVGFILGIFAHVMEFFILRKETLWMSTAIDFIAALAIIHLSQLLLRNVSINLMGTLLTALLVTIGEYFLHSYLIRTSEAKTGKK